MLNRTPHPPLAIARYGSLDVPLTVWTVEDAADLVRGLLTELAPTGPVVAVDLLGWEAAPASGWCTHAFYRRRSSVTRALGALAAAEQRRTAIEPACESNLAAKLRHRSAGMIAASAWLLRCPGALDGAVAALRPGGVLVIAGRSEQDAIDIAKLTDTSERPLAFTAYLVAASRGMLEAEAAERLAPAAATSASHWGIGVWHKTGKGGGAHG